MFLNFTLSSTCRAFRRCAAPWRVSMNVPEFHTVVDMSRFPPLRGSLASVKGLPKIPDCCRHVAAYRRGADSWPPSMKRSRWRCAQGMFEELCFEDRVGVQASKLERLAGDVYERLGGGHADQLARHYLDAVQGRLVANALEHHGHRRALRIEQVHRYLHDPRIGGAEATRLNGGQAAARLTNAARNRAGDTQVTCLQGHVVGNQW